MDFVQIWLVWLVWMVTLKLYMSLNFFGFFLSVYDINRRLRVTI